MVHGQAAMTVFSSTLGNTNFAMQADGDRPETFTGGGGGGIHRKNPHKRDHD